MALAVLALPLRGDLAAGAPALLDRCARLAASGRRSCCSGLGVPAGALCCGLPALQGAGEPRPLSHGVLRHAAALRRALCPARAGHRREPRQVRLRAVGRGATATRRFTDQANVPPRFKQVWFAGSHSDIGGSYPETESRLSDIALAWMVQEALSLPQPDPHRPLRAASSTPTAPGRSTTSARRSWRPVRGWLVRVRAAGSSTAKNFGWREGHRRDPARRGAASHRCSSGSSGRPS